MSSVRPLRMRSGVKHRTRSAMVMSMWQLNRVKIEWAVVAAEGRATGGHWKPTRARCAHEGGIQHESLHETKRSALRFDAPGVQSLPHGASDTRQKGGARSVPSRQRCQRLWHRWATWMCFRVAIAFWRWCLSLASWASAPPTLLLRALAKNWCPFTLKCPTSHFKDLPSLEPKWPRLRDCDEGWDFCDGE